MPNNFTTPDVNQTQDMFEIFKVINVASGDIFFPLVLFAIWVITFIGSIVEGRNASVAWVFACFVSTIIGIMFGVLELTAMRYVYLLIILLALGLFWLKLDNAED